MVRFPFKDPSKCRVTCHYGKPGNWSSGKHDGIDLVSDGSHTIYAVSAGICIRSGTNPSWGEYTVIQMPDGRSIVYAHLLKNSRQIGIGQSVDAGDIIGTMGNTGNSSGKHLHIELQSGYYKSGRTEDIAAYLGIKNVVGKVQEVDETEVQDLTVSVKGQPVTVKAVNVDGSNYVLLRDVPKLVPVMEVGYDAVKSMPKVE